MVPQTDPEKEKRIMSFTRWLRNLKSARPHRGAAGKHRAPARSRPRLEALEDRCLPSTLTVTTPLDEVNPNDGVLSLREAIQQANPATPGGDTIVFANSLNGQTITLNGNELLINKNLTIQGPGASQLAISANHLSRVFDVAANTQVTLAGLTISDGIAVGGPHGSGGGGIVNSGTLTVSFCTLSGNSATVGGGISNLGIAKVTDSSVSANSAQYGGGINNSSTLKMIRCTLSGNSATASGGGIYNATVDKGTLTITDSTITGNMATSTGGGLYNNSAASLQNTKVSNNSAGTQGGGIFNDVDGTLTLYFSSVVSGNSAPDGADLYNLGHVLRKKG
jgi:hypothetical protein